VVAGHIGNEVYPPGSNFPYGAAGAAMITLTDSLTPSLGNYMTLSSTTAGTAGVQSGSYPQNVNQATIGECLGNSFFKSSWGAGANVVLIKIIK
jgi:hypothetical protein